MPRRYRRFVEPRLRAALADTPVVFLTGARQTGKSTLAQTIARGPAGMRYVTFDDLATLASARADPEGFVQAQPGPVVLDEIQRVPELYLPIKAAVDRERRPGRFLLTGSAHAMVLPQLADALVGRMEILTLWPLSQGELAGTREAFVETVFGERLRPAPDALPLDRILDRLLVGGYPEAVARSHTRRSPARRWEWLRAYLTTLIERDVRELAAIEHLSQIPRLLSVIAAWSGRLLNFADLARVCQFPETTLKRYLALLRATYLMDTLPAWGGDLARRALRTPKVLLTDTGLATALLGIDARRLTAEPTLAGPLLETFVAMELRKQLGWSDEAVTLYHFRTRTGQEVDLVLERADGSVVGLEVKATSSPGPRDFAGLRALQELTGRRFRRGVLLYAGAHVLPFGERLAALPLSCLWQWTGASGARRPSHTRTTRRRGR
jgi:predicted AAA+ superfamily ATPase